ncbi:hypothetical protein ACYPKM_02225 [Pseudomonas aeruginosa]
MKVAELQALLNTGKPVVIELAIDLSAVGGQGEPGMRATLCSLRDHHNGLGSVTISYRGFEDFNQAFESHDYRDSKGSPTLTAREAGLYKDTEEFYIDIDVATGEIGTTGAPFTVVTDRYSALVDKFQASGQSSYITWLEEIASKALNVEPAGDAQ